MSTNRVKLSYFNYLFSNTTNTPISLSKYYKNANSLYTVNIGVFPNINSQFKFSYLHQAVNLNYINNISNSVYIYNNTSALTYIVFDNNISCKILMVGGGGGARGNNGQYNWTGAGGGGFVYYNENYVFTKGIYKITVGSGSYSTGNPTHILLPPLNDNYVLYTSGGGFGIELNINNYTNYGGNSGYKTNNNQLITYSGGAGNYPYPIIYFGGGAGATQSGSGINGGNGYLSDITGTNDVYGAGGRGAYIQSGNSANNGQGSYGSYGSGLYGLGGSSPISFYASSSGNGGCVIIRII